MGCCHELSEGGQSGGWTQSVRVGPIAYTWLRSTSTKTTLRGISIRYSLSRASIWDEEWGIEDNTITDSTASANTEIRDQHKCSVKSSKSISALDSQGLDIERQHWLSAYRLWCVWWVWSRAPPQGWSDCAEQTRDHRPLANTRLTVAECRPRDGRQSATAGVEVWLRTDSGLTHSDWALTAVSVKHRKLCQSRPQPPQSARDVSALRCGNQSALVSSQLRNSDCDARCAWLAVHCSPLLSSAVQSVCEPCGAAPAQASESSPLVTTPTTASMKH